MTTTPRTKPPGSTWTDEQWDAIALRGQNMLVAAAAGSGKTAVLVERIIRRISDEAAPLDVDRLLVATFTKAAAAEMKQRIREALEKELTAHPDSQHLKRQLALMGRASVTTLHSFCLEVIRRHYSLIRLDPGFRIANETEAELMRHDQLEEMMEQYYGESGEDSPFWRLVDTFGGERSDVPLHLLIQKLYDESRSHPWPEHWLREMANMFGPKNYELITGSDASGEDERTAALAEVSEGYAEAAAAVDAAANSATAGTTEQAASATEVEPVQHPAAERTHPDDPGGRETTERMAAERAETSAALESEGLTQELVPEAAATGAASSAGIEGSESEGAESALAADNKVNAGRSENEGEGAGASAEFWLKGLTDDVRLELQGTAELLKQALEITAQPGGPLPYATAVQDDLTMVEGLADIAGNYPWEILFRAFQSVSFGKLKPCKKDEVDPQLQEQVKQLRSRAKERITSLQEELFGRPPEKFLEETREMAPVIHALVDLVIDFGGRYSKAKAAKGLVDFADLEHFCLRILRAEESAPDHLVPSRAALEYREQFAEVLLDEYQDTNRVQEAIVELIAEPLPGNRFMVGDVKQSIYRFRLAEPGLFLEKYKSFTGDGRGPGRRIDLARNFRSRAEVVDAVNFIFRQIMNEGVGDIAYDERAELVNGASYPAAEGQNLSVEMMLIDRAAAAQASAGDETDGEEAAGEIPAEEQEGEPGGILEGQELETAQMEARAIARKIRAMLEPQDGQPYLVYDKRSGSMRPATYRDLVILLRATQQWSPIFIEELRQLGIPAYADLNTGYFTATEVEVMLSLLKVIDNPYQDVPLAGVLRSPIVGLTADELASLRISGKNIPFYEAVRAYAQGSRPPGNADGGNGLGDAAEWKPDEELRGKIADFLRRLEEWRSEARQGALARLIWKVYGDTGYFDFVGAMPGGQQRQANLRALYDRARQYENTSLRGLFRFLRFIERMKDTGGDLGTARALGEQEDVVRIMSIHKSKGLEFPVVFVAGLGKMFNQRDLLDPFLIHKELGFGPRFVDTELRVGYPTLPQLAIRRRMRIETLAEELRVLYVALTRAREKLFLLGTVRSLDKQLQGWGRHLEKNGWALPDDEVARARSYMDWLGPALMRHKDASLWREKAGLLEHNPPALAADGSKWSFEVIAPEELAAMGKADESVTIQADRMEALKHLNKVPTFTGEWDVALAKSLSWTYPFAQATAYFSKTSVSELKRQADRTTASDHEEIPSAELLPATGSGLILPTRLLKMAGAAEASRLNGEHSPGTPAFPGDTEGNRTGGNSLIRLTTFMDGPALIGAAERREREAAETWDAQEPQETRDAQDMQDTRDTQAAGNMQGRERPQLTQAAWNAQESQSAEDTQASSEPFDPPDEADGEAASGAAIPGTPSAASSARTSLLRRPRFMEEKKLTSAERGTVYHAVMQHMPLKEVTPAAVEAVIREMTDKELLTPAQARAVDAEILAGFFRTDIGSKLAASTRVWREVPFSLGLPAGRVYPNADASTRQETVLVQGVIDCLFEYDGHLIMLDYKTDRVKGTGLEALRERYRIQLGLYGQAVEKIWKRKLAGTYLFFFDGGHVVEI
ncbi:helicase-exonuclease AddAB subunit AddA [Paenibacillus sp. UNC499MF]|uniref:helicase-exonuclease AddAB subunit AddA n=1 Tax=Paenibacillus sp. UNC499MF TaxID=1502751 RepID=UPI00089FD019|nr:helicase-exonuclease AddAB subunit AddA [Paenibacillus sp. UNC499MF]SEF49405.1 DNA helicase/exodeoxyribonuclease V, subunit A [Paenibacillus sp. UNC499MF]